MNTHYLFRSFVLVPFAAVCLAAGPTAPVATRPATSSDSLPAIDASGELPTNETFATLAKTDAIAALKAGILKAQREQRGFRATFLKQERIGGTLHAPEEIAVAFREEPYAVKMMWRTGSRLFAEGTIFANGENDGKMLVWLPAVFGKVSKVATRDAVARGSSRYCIEDFGLRTAGQRTLKSWLAAREKGELTVEYLGLQTTPELAGKMCHAIRRTWRADTIDPFLLGDPPTPVTDKNRNDAFRTVTIYLDPETWQQYGTEQERADGERVGAYFFRDVEMNPAFTAEEFKQASFKK